MWTFPDVRPFQSIAMKPKRAENKTVHTETLDVKSINIVQYKKQHRQATLAPAVPTKIHIRKKKNENKKKTKSIEKS